ncbi:hypothetical protein ACFLRB_05885, partial [Acidobacteriota bacterium]
SGQEITPEAALCKLMVILGQKEIDKLDLKTVTARINQNIAGEQNFSIYNTNLKSGDFLEDKPYFWYRIPATSLEGIFNQEDRSRVERAILRFGNALVKKDPEYIFSLKTEFKEELNNDKKQRLIPKFEDKDIILSDNLEIIKIDNRNWKIKDNVNIYVIKDADSELKVFEDEKPLEISIYIDLPPDPEDFQEDRCFAGKCLKQQNETKQSITFDITQIAKKLLEPSTSFTIRVEDKEGSFEFEGVELSLFLK